MVANNKWEAEEAASSRSLGTNFYLRTLGVEEDTNRSKGVNKTNKDSSSASSRTSSCRVETPATLLVVAAEDKMLTGQAWATRGATTNKS